MRLTLIGVGLLLGSLAMLVPSTSKASSSSVNGTINFQGRLLTAAGAVVPDGSYNIEFKLYKNGNGQSAGDSGGSPAGSLLWTEDWVYGTGSPDNRVVVKNGYFSVQLGSITALPSNLSLDESNLWLSMNIENPTGATLQCTGFSSNSPTGCSGGDGEMTPMKQLGAAPYAINAANANQVNSYGLSNNFLDLAAPSGISAANGSAGSVPGTVCYTVTATNANGETVATNNSGTVTPGGTHVVNVTWSQVTGATGYKIYRNTSCSFTSGSLFLTTITSGSITTYQDTATSTSAGLPPTTVTGGTVDIQAWSSQTSNLLQLQNSSGTNVLSVDPSGDTTVAGVITVAGGAAQDITTAGAATATAITIQPGTSSTASTGATLNLQGGNDSGTSGVTAGTVAIQGGNATGASGTRNGGNVTIDAGTGANANGSITIGGTASGTNTTGVTVNVATDATASGKTDTINIGTGNGAGGSGTAKAVNIASGTPGGTEINTVLIGSLANASTTTLQGGTSGTGIALTTGSGGTIALTAAGAGNVTVTATNASLNSSGVLNVVGGSAGFNIGGSTTTGNYLRNNGTNFVSSAIQYGDIPTCGGTCNYIGNQITTQSNANFNIKSAASSSVGGAIQGATSQTADLFDLRDSTGANLLSVSAAGNQELGGYEDVSGMGGFGSFGNLLLQSEALDQTGDWTASNITVTANNTVAPDGTTTAEKLAATVSGTHSMTQICTTGCTTNSVTYTYSIWVRADAANNPTNVQLRIDWNNGSGQTGTAATFSATTTWQRFSVTQAVSASGMVSVTPTLLVSTNSVTVYAWGAQLNLGSTPGVYEQTVLSQIIAGEGEALNGYLTIVSPSNGGITRIDGYGNMSLAGQLTTGDMATLNTYTTSDSALQAVQVGSGFTVPTAIIDGGTSPGAGADLLQLQSNGTPVARFNNAGNLFVASAINTQTGGGTLSVQTTGNGAITTGSGLLTDGGNLTVQGTTTTLGATGSANTLGFANTTAATGATIDFASTSVGIGNSLTVQGQTGAATDAGGAVNVYGGTGGTTGGGGLVTIQGGAASATSGSAGGGVDIYGANGTGTSTGGAGGSVAIQAGNGTSSGNNSGGNVTLQAGSASGSGATGSVVVKNAANSSTALQLQDTAGVDVLDGSTSTTNLVSQPDITGSTASSWAVKNGSSAPVGDTSNPYETTSSIKTVASGSTAYSGMQTSTFTSALVPNDYYQLTFWAKCSGTIGTFTFGRQDVSGTDINYTTTTCNTTWQQYWATWQAGGTLTSPNIYIDAGTPANATTIWVDGVTLNQVGGLATGPSNYQPGTVYIPGVIGSPVTFENSANSAGAFQVQNSAGANILNVNTSTSTVTVGSSGNDNVSLAVDNTDGTAAIEVRSGGSASYDTFVGVNSGANNALNVGSTQGYQNTGFGNGALQSNSTGSYNTGLGVYALNANHSGSDNTAVGNGALNVMNGGSDDDALGFQSQYDNSSGSYNVSIGSYSQYYIGGSDNTSLGYHSLTNSSDTTGADNTALGYNAASTDSASGFVSDLNLQNATAIGYDSEVQANNSFILGGQGSNAVNVGIGTTIPLNTLSVSPANYSTGTAEIASTGTTVTGSGTTWTNAMVGMQFIFMNGETGTITAVASTTSLTISASQAATGGFINYRIQTPGFNVTSNGAAFIQATNSSAFAVQNAQGESDLVANTTDSTNFILDSDMVLNSGTSLVDWSAVSSATVTQNTTPTDSYLGNTSMNLTTTNASSGQGATTTAFTPSLPTGSGTVYTVSFEAMMSTGTYAASNLKMIATGGGTPSCTGSASETINANGFQQVSCTWAADSGTISGLSILDQTANAMTMYIDDVQLQTGTAATAFNLGTLQLKGVITSPVAVQNVVNSTTALQVQNASGFNVLTVDTLDNSGQGQVILGAASHNNGALVFDNSTNSNTVSLVSGATSGSGYSLTLPTSGPTYNQCLQTGNSSTTQLQFGPCATANANLTKVAESDEHSGNALTFTPSKIGDEIVLFYSSTTASVTVSAMNTTSGTGVTTWTKVTSATGTKGDVDMWMGQVTGTGSTTVTATVTGSPSTFELTQIEYTTSGVSSGTVWQMTNSNTNYITVATTTVTWPSFVAPASQEAYVGYDSNVGGTPSTSGTGPFTYTLTGANNMWVYDSSTVYGSTYAPTTTVASSFPETIGGLLIAYNPSSISNSTATQVANFNVQAATSGSVAGLLQANAAGSGDILDLENGSGNLVDNVTSNGVLQVQSASGVNVLTADNTIDAVTLGGAAAPSYVNEWEANSTSGYPTISAFSPTTIGDVMVVAIKTVPGNKVTSVTDTDVSAWHYVTYNNGNVHEELWYGTITSTASTTMTFNSISGTPCTAGVSCEIVAEEFTAGLGANTNWFATTSNTTTTGSPSSTISFPSLKATVTNGLYWGFAYSGGTAGSCITGGFTCLTTPKGNDVIYDPTMVNGTTYSPTANNTSNVYDTLGMILVASTSNLNVVGTTQLNGAVTSPVVFANSVNSATAFQIQNASGADAFLVDNTNSGLVQSDDTLQIGPGSPGTTTPKFLYLSDVTSNGAGNPLIIGQWNSPGNWGIGPNSNANDNTLRLGVTTANGVNTWSTTQNVSLLVAGTLAVQPTSGNDSTSAFQVASSAGTNLVNVDTANGNVNLGISSSTPALGDTAGSGTADTVYANTIHAGRFQASYTGPITSISAYVGQGGLDGTNKLYQVALYTDTTCFGHQCPGTYIASSAQGTLSGSATWDTAAVSATVTAGTYYWLAYTSNSTITNDNTLSYNTAAAGSLDEETGFTFGSGPSNGFPTTFVYQPPQAGYSYSIYATYGSGYATTINSSGTLTQNAAAVFKDETSSATALQVQNTDGESVFQTGTTQAVDGITNYVADSEFALGSGACPLTDWSVVGSPTTCAQNTTAANSYEADTSLQLVTTASAGQGASTSTFTATPTTTSSGQGSIWTVSFYAEQTSGTTPITGANLTAATTGVVSSNTCTINGSTSTPLSATGFAQVVCTLTYSSGGNITGLTIETSGTVTADTIYLSNVQYQVGTATTGFVTAPQIGQLSLRGVINTPIEMQNNANSSTAFQIQNAGGNALVDVNSNNVNINTTSVNGTGLSTVNSAKEWSVLESTTVVANPATNSYTWTNGVSPHTVGNVMVMGIGIASTTFSVSSITGGGVTNWHKITANAPGTTDHTELWYGTVTSAGTTNVVINFSGTVNVPTELINQEFTAGLGAGTNWSVTTSGQQSNGSSTSMTFPSLTSGANGGIYVGYGNEAANNATVGTSPGFTFEPTPTNLDMYLYNPSLAANTVYQPIAGITGAAVSNVTGAILTASADNTFSTNGSTVVGGAASQTAFQVQNASGGSVFNVDSSNNIISLESGYSGTIGSWQPDTNSLPAIMGTGAAVAANGYVYEESGSNNGTVNGDLYSAKLNPDGTVGTWSAALTVPSTPVKFEATVATNGYIYELGGTNNGGTDQSTVQYAQILPNGTLGAWSTTTVLPALTSRAAAVAANGYIYVIGGDTAGGTTGSTIVYYGKVNADGTISNWTTGGALTAASRDIQAVYANGYIIAAGGGDGTNAQTTVQTSAVPAAGGANGAFSTTGDTALTGGRAQATMGVANGYVYVVGGRNTDSTNAPQTSTYYGQLNSAGQIGSWSSVSTADALPIPVFGHSMVTVNGYMIIMGGFNSSGTLVSGVYTATTARIAVDASLDLVGSSSGTLADGGDQSTGSSGGSLTAGNTNIVGSLQVADQADFNSNISVDGNLVQDGDSYENSSQTTGTAFTLTDSSLTTGTLATFTTGTSTTNLTSGNLVNVATVSAVQSAGSLVNVSNTANLVTSAGSDAANLVNVSRSLTATISGGTSNVPTVDPAGTGTGPESLNNTTGTNSWSNNFTVASHSNEILLVQVGYIATSCANYHLTSVTYNGTAMTLLSYNQMTNDCVGFYYLLAPTTGSAKALIVNSTASDNFTENISAWYNVNQTTPFTTVGGGAYSSNNGTSSTSSLSASSAPGQVVFDYLVVSATASTTPATTQSGQTMLSSVTDAATNLIQFADSDRAASLSSGNTTMGWNSMANAGANGWVESSIGLNSTNTNVSENVTSAVASITNNCTATGSGDSICADASNVLKLNQQYSNATGAELLLQSAGTGDMLDTENAGGTILDKIMANGSIVIGPSGGGYTPATLTLGTGTGADPAGVAGAMYYNTALDEYRCYGDNGEWSPCGTLPIDASYDLNEDFLGGSAVATTATTGIGSNNWTVTTIGTACTSLGYGGSGGQYLVSAARPGILTTATSATSGAGCTVALGGAADMKVGAGEDIKASVGVSSASAHIYRVGLLTETNSATAPNFGVWWEADSGSGHAGATDWQYCYGTGSAVTCGDSGIAIGTLIWYRLEIQIVSATAINYYINGTLKPVTGITLGTSTAVGPDIVCANDTGTATAFSCNTDYYQLRADDGALR